MQEIDVRGQFGSKLRGQGECGTTLGWEGAQWHIAMHGIGLDMSWG